MNFILKSTTALVFTLVLTGCLEQEPKHENWDQMMDTSGAPNYEDVLNKYTTSEERAVIEEKAEELQNKK